MLSGMTRHARARASTSRRSGGSCSLLVGVYLLSAVFGWAAAATSWPASRSAPSTGCAATSTRSSAACRSRYFDGHAARRHAEPGHQRHRQHLPDAAADPDAAHHVAAHDRRRAHHDVLRSARCWRVDLAARASRSSVVVTMLIAKRSQKQFAAQWERTGDAQRPRRGDVHRPQRRQGVRPPATRRSRRSTSENEELYEASFRAQFISGHHPAGDERSSATSTTSPSP